MSERGRLVVLSASSGGGKSTVIREILRRRPEFVYSISTTTRPRRDYEVDTVHYNFISREEFRRGILEGRFAEWSEVHGELYGTERAAIEQANARGKHVLLDIDVNGGEAIHRLYPDSLLIFIYPPSLEELRRRLRQRGSDDEAAIERRLQRYPLERAKGDKYPYRILNENLESTVNEILRIIDNNR